MTIILYTLGKGGEHVLSHDLNFAQERYEADHIIVSAPITPGALEMDVPNTLACRPSRIQSPN